MNPDTRSMQAELKGVDDAGAWEAVASTDSIDRDNEVVVARCMEPLPAKVPVRLGHFGGPLVGSGVPRYAGNELLLSGRFASTPAGQEARTLAREGHLSSMSVVFLPVEDKQVEGRRHITRAELLAIDFVEIPSNRNARLLAVRDYQGRTNAGDAARLLAFKAQLALLEADIAEFDLADARRTLDEIKSADAAQITPADARRMVAEAQQFVADLNRRDR